MQLRICERRLLFITWALRGIFNPRPLISSILYLILYCTETTLPDLVRHVGTGTGLFLQNKLRPISFNPLTLSSSERNAEPRCKNTNAPRLLLSHVNKCKLIYGSENMVMRLLAIIPHGQGCLGFGGGPSFPRWVCLRGGPPPLRNLWMCLGT